jgi:two-component system chemotaxis sensor kinase CheA
LAAFQQEAAQRLGAMRAALAALASGAEAPAARDRLRHEAHGLAGSAGMVGRDNLALLARLLERLAATPLDAAQVPLLTQVLDLALSVDEPLPPAQRQAADEVLARLVALPGSVPTRFAWGLPPPPPAAPASPRSSQAAAAARRAAQRPAAPAGADQDLLRQLRQAFAGEATDHLATLSAGLLQLEQAPPGGAAAVLGQCLRAAHSLKGASRAIDLLEIEQVCAELERVLAAIKAGAFLPAAEHYDVLHRGLDLLGALLAPGPTTAAQVPRVMAQLRLLASDLAATAAAPPPPTAAQESSPLPAADDSLRVPAARLDALLRRAEELYSAKQLAAEWPARLAELHAQLDHSHQRLRHLAPHLRHLQQEFDLPPGAVAHLLADVQAERDHLAQEERLLNQLLLQAERERLAIGALVDALLVDAKRALMVPFASATRRLPKLVRDLARDLGKEARLVIAGDDLEVDRRILAELYDPLTHLLRNCLDHGLEAPAARVAAGKSPIGTICLDIAPFAGSRVLVTVADDGGGVPLALVREKAIARGLLTPEAAPLATPAQLHELIFLPEFTTSPLVTDISGRGLGLAIVREHLDRLGGQVTVQSELGLGARFALVVPLTLATFRGLEVTAAQQTYVVPMAQVVAVQRLPAEGLRQVEGRPAITFRGQPLAVVPLAAVLGLPPGPAARHQALLVLSHHDQQIAFLVEAVAGELEVLVKPLEPPLAGLRHYAGATVLGSGKVVPVLHVADLLRTATAQATGPLPAAAPAAAPRRVLVAEDSITSRMLLRNILTAAGYQVATAVDGAEALAQLQQEPFDLLVSDVDMPRLDGFDLTARVRADRRLAQLPVVLVTARDSRADRERGIDVGANAYLVKSGFDQTNLLTLIKQLL